MSVKTRYDDATLQRVTFGVRLGDLMKRDTHKNLVIPDIVYKCIRQLNARALELQGVFRVPGNTNKMKDYEQLFDKDGIKVDFAKSDDEHMVASMLKMFLRDMPEPVMPYSLFEATVDATTKQSKEQIILALREVLAQIPNVNYRLLTITCCLLHKITLHVDKNLMKPTNLAIVFGPVFCAQPPTEDVTRQQMVSKLPALSSAVEYMISEFNAIFTILQKEDPIEDVVQCENNLTKYEELLKMRKQGSNTPVPSTQPVSADENLVIENTKAAQPEALVA